LSAFSFLCRSQGGAWIIWSHFDRKAEQGKIAFPIKISDDFMDEKEKAQPRHCGDLRGI
jgi:hypothetical protein